MSNHPIALDNNPPGYQSQQHRQRYRSLMTILLVLCFLAQGIVPIVVYLGGLRSLIQFGSWQNHPLYFDMFVWRDALWYPTWSVRGGCTLRALDFQGKPVPGRQIYLPGKFHRFIADGDRLWGCDGYSVSEIDSKGSQPWNESFTKRFEKNSNAFLYDGKLAIVGLDERATLALYVFEHEEWRLKEELVCGDSIPDALKPVDRDHEIAVRTRQINPTPFVDPFDEFKVVKIADSYFAVSFFFPKYFHHEHLPFKSDDPSKTSPETWVAMPNVDVNPMASEITSVAGDLALLKISADKTEVQLWRYADGKWAEFAKVPVETPGSITRLSAFTSPDGSRSFAVFEFFEGRSTELMELYPDSMEKIVNLGNSKMDYRPSDSSMSRLTIFAFAFSFLPLLLIVPIASTLIKSHREPCYFKGHVAVKFASLGCRCLASLLDFAHWAGPVAVIWLAYRRLGNSQESNHGNPEAAVSWLLPSLLATAGWTAMFAVINWLMLALSGFTIGKRLLGVRVVQLSLRPPGLWPSLIRLFIWPVETAFFSGIMALSFIAFTDNRQRLADLMSGCVVLDAGDLQRATDSDAEKS